MKVFLAERSELVRERLKSALAELKGITLAGESGNPLAVLGAVLAARPDILVLDFCMAGPELELIQEAKRENPALVTMLFTQKSERPYREKARVAGADHFFVKVGGFEELSRTIHDLANEPERKSLESIYAVG